LEQEKILEKRMCDLSVKKISKTSQKVLFETTIIVVLQVPFRQEMIKMYRYMTSKHVGRKEISENELSRRS